MFTTDVLNKFILKHLELSVTHIKDKQVCLENSIKIKREWYYFKLYCPEFPMLKNMQLLVRKGITLQCLTATSPCIKPSWNIEELLQEMPSIIMQINDIKQTPQTIVQNIYAELASLYNPEAYEIEYNEDVSIIKFTKFAQNEQHYIEVQTSTLQVLDHTLPDCVQLTELLERCQSLTAVVQQFQRILEELRCFYDNFADIDELCHVIQPKPATTKHNWRLFPLRERIFIKLHISDAFAPVASMSVQFIGPNKDVEQLRRIYSQGLNNWDNELDIHKNLLRIFDLCFFPMPPNAMYTQATTAQQPEQECSICYCYQLDDGEVPVVSCDNSRCSLLCHAACLKQWFHALTTSKAFLDVSFLECPFCKSEFSTTFAQTLLN